MAATRRPMALEELAEAISIRPDDETWHDCQRRLPNDYTKMIENCGNLVIISDSDHFVQFAHGSVLQFLKHLSQQGDQYHTQFCINMCQADLDATRVCLTYLNLGQLQTQLTTKPQATTKTFLSSPMSQWVPTMTGLHRGGGTVSDFLFNQYLRFGSRDARESDIQNLLLPQPGIQSPIVTCGECELQRQVSKCNSTSRSM